MSNAPSHVASRIASYSSKQDIAFICPGCFFGMEYHRSWSYQILYAVEDRAHQRMRSNVTQDVMRCHTSTAKENFVLQNTNTPGSINHTGEATS